MTTSGELEPSAALGDGVVQLRLPMRGNPLRYVNGYLIEESDGLTLVDCGWKTDDVQAALENGLAAHGYTLADVRRILATHQHFDHYGLAGTLRRAGVPELMMHRLDWERVQEVIADRSASDAAADEWFARHGFRPDADDGSWLARAELTPPTRLLEDGDRIGRLVAWWTPGHAPGHLCFFDGRSGRMLTGDHVLDPITPHVGCWRERHEDPLGDYLASLARLLVLEGAGALPGHGEPFADLAARVRAIVAHTEHRERAVIAILAAEPCTATTVARRLPWTRRERRFDELGGWHQEFAVSETIAHLEHLRLRGRAIREATAGTLVYRLNGSAA